MCTSVPQMPVLSDPDQHIVDADSGLRNIFEPQARLRAWLLTRAFMEVALPITASYLIEI